MVGETVAHQLHALELRAKLRALGINVAAMSGTVPAPLVFWFLPFTHFN
jgi:hypothetical protein